MKHTFILLILSVIILTGCSSSTAKSTEEDTIEQAVVLNPVNGYFTTMRPTEDTALVMAKAAFEENFKPAATMNNIPTSINFDTEHTLAIVLPETNNSVEIVIDSAYQKDSVLYVSYSINRSNEGRSFSIIPVKICTFGANLGITTVSFNDGEAVVDVSR